MNKTNRMTKEESTNNVKLTYQAPQYSKWSTIFFFWHN